MHSTCRGNITCHGILFTWNIRKGYLAIDFCTCIRNRTYRNTPETLQGSEYKHEADKLAEIKSNTKARCYTMEENIIAKLTSKDDKYACAIAAKIISESQETDAWYEYFDDFASLLDHPKSYVRNRALQDRKSVV